MDYTTLLSWLKDGGAAGAVIVVVILFLRQQDKMAALIVAVTDRFTAALEHYQARADEKLQTISDQNNEHNQKTQEQVNVLVRDQIVVNTQLIEAVKGLQAAVSELQKKG